MVNNKPNKRSSAALLHLLALHGNRSNNDVTRLELENLGINAADYDISMLQVPLEVSDRNPDLGELAHGSFSS